jgi:hypothetical protein
MGQFDDSFPLLLSLDGRGGVRVIGHPPLLIPLPSPPEADQPLAEREGISGAPAAWLRGRNSYAPILCRSII